MKLLLKIAVRNSKHLVLAILALVSLLALSFADSMERFSVGLMVNTGSDFFTLFAPVKKGTLYPEEQISKEQILEKWHKIDVDGTGYISKKDATSYVNHRKTNNPLTMILRKASAKFDVNGNFFGLIIVLVFVALFKAIFLFVSRYITQILSIRVTRDIRQQFFDHIQSLPLSFYYKHNMGTLAARAVGDAGQISSSLNSCLTNYLQTPFIILANLITCFYLSWRLSLIIFVGIPLVVFPVIFLTKRVKRISRQLQRNQENFTSVLLDFLGGIQTIKLFSMESFSKKKYEDQNDQMARLETKSAKYSLLTRPVLHTITTTCMATIVIVGLFVLGMNISELIVFILLLHLVYEPVKKWAEENANVQRGIVAAERLFEVLNLKPNITDKDGALELTEFKDEIRFENVSFKYNDTWVLEDISFTVKKGQTVAIVGPTGAGKSTIVQLLPRLYDPQKGDIFIDGRSIKEYTQKSLRMSMAFVPQKPFLFYDSVYENISFGQDFSYQEIVDAAKKAHAHEFVEKLPNQYHTILAETGKSLSGGQQQRLAIARALVKNSPILVMDEATSSLDSISENMIKDAIVNLHHKYTQIIIAHRLSTIEHADKIIYLEGGRKIIEGTKDVLLKDSVSFRRMWESFHRKEYVQEEV